MNIKQQNSALDIIEIIRNQTTPKHIGEQECLDNDAINLLIEFAKVYNCNLLTNN